MVLRVSGGFASVQQGAVVVQSWPKDSPSQPGSSESGGLARNAFPEWTRPVALAAATR